MGLQRTPDGLQSLMLVRDGKIDQVNVTTGNALNGRWVVTSGLKAGDVVVVEGFQKVRPGAPVKVSQWTPGQQQQGGPAAGGAQQAPAGAQQTAPAGTQPQAPASGQQPAPAAQSGKQPAPQQPAAPAGQKS